MSRKLALDEHFKDGQLDPTVWKVAKTLDFFQTYDAYDGEQVKALTRQVNALMGKVEPVKDAGPVRGRPEEI